MHTIVNQSIINVSTADIKMITLVVQCSDGLLICMVEEWPTTIQLRQHNWLHVVEWLIDFNATSAVFQLYIVAWTNYIINLDTYVQAP